MEIKILFDSNAIDSKFQTGWGFSCLINGRILFDTGEKGEWLLHNIKQMNIDINNIQSIVISHDHWDHTGGLWDVLQLKKNLPVYSCPGFSKNFKENVRKLKGILIESNHFQQIEENISVTGEIEAIYNGKTISEQAVVIKTKNGISIITGCAHPGILNIVKIAKQHFPDEQVFLVMGGFHLLDADTRIIEYIATELKTMNVKTVGPCHCSGKNAEEIFQQIFQKNFLAVKAGMTVKV